MSEEIGRLNRLVEDAAGIIAGTKGRTKTMDAMKFIGFSESERKNMKLYQQVRRLAEKLQVVEVKKKPGPVAAVSIDTQELVSALTSGSTPEESSDNGTAANAAASSRSARRQLVEIGGNKSSEKLVKKKKSRRSSKEVQRSQAEALMLTSRDKNAMKLATRMIHRSNSLPKNDRNKSTMLEIVTAVNKANNSNISVVTAARYVRMGLVGVSPMKRGPQGDFPEEVFDALKGAFATYLKLEQATGKKQSTIRQLSLLVNACVNKAGYNKTRDDLTRKLKKQCADQFEVGKANVIEQRRMMWTTHYNLDVWFTTWKNMLIELGFGRARTIDDDDAVDEGEVIFFIGQRDRIGKVDATDGSLDDTTGQRGGRPSMTFHAPDVSGGGTAVNKSGYSATVICGSTAAGDPFPAHFQLMSKAQTDSRKRISLDWFQHTKQVIGKFGFPTRRAFPCTFGMRMNVPEWTRWN